MSDVKAIIEGGKASAGAPLGPALGPLGVNIGKVIEEINAKTKAFAGIKVPVTVSVAKDKSFEVTVGSPPSSALILKELKIKKGAGNPKTENVGNLTLEQLKKIAEMKLENMTCTQVKKAMNELAGTCKQMGITIENQDPREVIKQINSGELDSKI